MRVFLRKLSRFFATIFAILFVLSIPFSVLLYNVEKYAFAPRVYEQAFVEEDAYAALPKILAKRLQMDFAKNPEASPYMKALSQEQWEYLLNDIFPPDEVQSLAEDAIVRVFAYLNGKIDKAVLSLTPIKQKLNGPEGVDAILNFLQTQPPCSVEDVEKALNPSEGEALFCQPPEEAIPLLRPLLHLKLKSVAAEIPNQIELIDLSPEAIAHLRTARLLMRLSPLVPIFALLLTTLLAVRSLKGWFLWWGVPSFVGGVLAALIGWLLPVFYTAMFYTHLAVEIPKEAQPLALGISLKILSYPIHAMTVAGILFAVVGGILWAIAAFLKSPAEAEAQSL